MMNDKYKMNHFYPLYLSIYINFLINYNIITITIYFSTLLR